MKIKLILLLIPFFYSCTSIHTFTTTTTQDLWANAHPVVIDSTNLFKYILYLPPVFKGESFDVKVKLFNISDTIQSATPDLFYLTYYSYQRGIIESNYAFNPVLKMLQEQNLDSSQFFKDDHLDSDSTRNRYSSNSLLSELVTSENEEVKNGTHSQIYTWKNEFRPSKKSTLVTELRLIEKYWLQPASLLPHQYTEGTLRFNLPDNYMNLKLYFSDGDKLVQLPVEIVKKSGQALKREL